MSKRDGSDEKPNAVFTFMNDFEALLVHKDETTLTVTINRPEALNALNQTVLRSLSELLNWVEKQSFNDVRSMIITGQGEKAFVAGADIKEFENLDAKAASQFSSRGQKLFSQIESLKIPVIAAVNGFALGGGLELALACDFIYASENAKFALPECTLGLMPGYGGTVRLLSKVGMAKAKELTFTGSMITAQEALSAGLVNKVVPPAELLKTVRETARVMATRAPMALARIKRSIHESARMTESEAFSLEAELFGELFSTEDRTEGVRAFIDKRKPSFKGK
jgi:enoyl-CoA hydratase